MALYTRTGDKGYSQLQDSRRRPKSDVLFEVVGSLDEFSAHLGLCIAGASAMKEGELTAAGSMAPKAGLALLRECLAPLQAELLVIGAMLARGPQKPGDELSVDPSMVLRMERQIDVISEALPPLAHFVLLQGSELSCRLHVARTVCRRAERAIAASSELQPVGEVILQYINRLSDLLFVVARLANHLQGQAEVVWRG